MSKPVSLQTALEAHEEALSHGGVPGIRDMNALLAALNAPWMSMMGQDFYPTEIEKACRLAFEIISQHSFADGNKRTATVLFLMLVRTEHVPLSCSIDQLHDTLIKVASGKAGYEDLLQISSSNPKHKQSPHR